MGGDLKLGPAGVGSVAQTGGSVTVAGGVSLGDGSSYSLSDARLTSAGISVGTGASFVASGTTSLIRVSGDVFISDDAAEVSTLDTHLVIANGSEVNFSVNGEDIGADPFGLIDGYAVRHLTLENNVTLNLVGIAGQEALYVDVFDVSPNAVFRLNNVIVGNGINIYYNGDNEENRYLAGASYWLGNGGKLIPFSLEAEAATAFGTLSTSEFGSGPIGAVPEPSTWGLLLLGLATLLLRRTSLVAR